MKLQILTLLLACFSLTLFQSCGGAGARVGVKAVQNLVKSFSKTAGRNSAKLTKLRLSAQTRGLTVKNGRYVPYNQIAKLGKSPRATRLSVIRTASMEGSPMASNAVKSAEIDLVLYDSYGKAIMYANPTEHAIVYRAASRAYQGKAIRVVDDIYNAVNKSKITSDAELSRVIGQTLEKNLGNNAARPYVFDASSGQLTFHVEFANRSQIVGSLNIYSTVKKGIVIGAGGYYLAKKI